MNAATANNARTRALITPEGVPLEIDLASLATRGIAFVIDSAFTLGIVLVAFIFAELFHATSSQSMLSPGP